MPKINKNTIVFDYDDFKELNIQTSSSVGLKGSGMAFSARINPFRRLGFVSPGQHPTTITNYTAANDLLTNGVVYNNKAYFMTQGDEMHEIAVLTTTMTTPADNTIAAAGIHSGHSTFRGEDIVLYKHNIGGTSTLSALYSWNDSTDGDIGRFDLSSTYDDDWMSNVVTTTAPLSNDSSSYTPHPLIVGDDDILYAGDENVVHQYDGATGSNGTWTANVYVLPTKYRIVKFLKHEDKLVVFAYDKNSGSSYTSGEVRAFFFNYFDPDPVYYKDLHDNYISEAISANGTMYAFTQGGPTDYLSSKTAKLQVFNGKEFEVLTTFSGTAPIRGGVDVRNGQILWTGAASGIVFSWGSPLLGLKAGLNKISSGTGSSLGGALKVLGGSFVLVCTKSGGGTVYTENMEQSNYATTAIIDTCIAEPLFNEGDYGKIEKVRVEFGGTATDGQLLTVTLKDTVGNSANVIDSTNAQSSITKSNMIQEFFKDTSDANFFHFKDLKLYLTWFNSGDPDYTDAQEISRIVIYFDTINL